MYKVAIYKRVLRQWDNFSVVVSTEKQHNACVYKMQLKHIIHYHFSRWQIEFNLIRHERVLNAIFERRRMLKIFAKWKGRSEDLINLRNKGKKYNDHRCRKIKQRHFDVWHNLFQREQSKWAHIQQWIVDKKQSQCLLHLQSWKCFASQRKQHREQVLYGINESSLLIYDMMTDGISKALF